MLNAEQSSCNCRQHANENLFVSAQYQFQKENVIHVEIETRFRPLFKIQVNVECAINGEGFRYPLLEHGKMHFFEYLL